MPSSYTLGKHFEAFVQAQLASGRYGNASEVLRDALRLMEDREKRLQALDAALSKGIADADAGLVHDGDAVFDDLLARLEALPNKAAIRRAQGLVARHVPADAGLSDELIDDRHAAADIE
jgi:antitoxin ParD1/3/4